MVLLMIKKKGVFLGPFSLVLGLLRNINKHGPSLGLGLGLGYGYDLDPLSPATLVVYSWERSKRSFDSTNQEVFVWFAYGAQGICGPQISPLCGPSKERDL